MRGEDDKQGAKSARSTVGADKAYDTRDFIADCEFMGVEPHVAANEGPRRSSAVDRRIRRKAGYAVSQRKRKLVEEVFGWMKTVGGFRRTRFKGLLLTQLAAHMVATAYNLLRMAKLVEVV
jgi:IS5 family transposase